jgi:hypothetical protein
MDDLPTTHKHFVTLKYFVVEMLGYADVVSYYNHMHEPGFPQRVYPTSAKKPMLVYEECVAYQERVMNARAVAKTEPRLRKRTEPVKKKAKRGRPAGKKIPA